MGHRALVARERPDGRYDCYYSHWGGADLSLARDLEREPWTHPQVDPDPLATDVPWADLLSTHLDALSHELLVVLPAAGPPAAHRPLWTGPLDVPSLLVAVDHTRRADDAHVRGLFAGARAALVAAVEVGDLGPGAAGAALERTLEDRFDDRELVWLER
jgi:hypothetical protein